MIAISFFHFYLADPTVENHECEWCSLNEKAMLRTFGHLRSMVAAYREQKYGKEAKNYYNAVNDCLLDFDDELTVLEVISPAELHCYLGK